MKTLRELITSLARLFSEPDRHRRGWRLLWRALRRAVRVLLRAERRRPRRHGDCCVDLPSDVYKRPDPLIYDQYYLMKMGLSVTWDNPDIQLFEVDGTAPGGIGAPVQSSALQPNHPYKVQVRVWNGSYDAPAVGLPVHLSYLSFGAATISTPIATTYVDLGVKGSAHHPAFAVFDWTTPAAGHYCLQARLEWADDANPDNNLGQENVDVRAHHSPAEFSLMLRNDASVRRRFVLEADTYRLPDLPSCDQPAAQAWVVPTRHGAPPPTRLAESRARWEHARREQGYGAFPLPPEWTVVIEPSELVLAAREERKIDVSIDPQQGFELATVNVHAFVLREDRTRHIVGGATFYVAKA
jgi:hypothetical protein